MVISQDKSFINMLISVYGTIGDTSMLIIGSDDWVDIKELNTKTLMKLNVHIPFANYIDINSPEIYYLSNLPARINYYEVIFIIIISLFLTIIATIYPAIKSSRINPINVIRNG